MTLAGAAGAWFLGGWTGTRVAALGAIAACFVARGGNLGFGMLRSRFRWLLVVGAWTLIVLLPLAAEHAGMTAAAASGLAIAAVTALGVAGILRSVPRGTRTTSSARLGPGTESSA